MRLPVLKEEIAFEVAQVTSEKPFTIATVSGIIERGNRVIRKKGVKRRKPIQQ